MAVSVPRRFLPFRASDQVLMTQADGDGAGSLVRAWATRHDDGTVDVLVWNGTVNVALPAGDPRLDRKVKLTVTGLCASAYLANLARVDEHPLEHRGVWGAPAWAARPMSAAAFRAAPDLPFAASGTATAARPAV